MPEHVIASAAVPGNSFKFYSLNTEGVLVISVVITRSHMDAAGSHQQVPIGAEGLSAEDLLATVYTELRSLAASKLARESPGQTLQPTALVHEVWLKLSTGQPRTWKNRAHFFAAAAEAMRRILIDRARAKRAVRHGGDQRRTEIHEADLAAAQDDGTLLELNEVLDRFAQQEPAKADLVKLRYFVGLTLEEAADALGISPATAKRSWAYARAWLFREMSRSH